MISLGKVIEKMSSFTIKVDGTIVIIYLLYAPFVLFVFSTVTLVIGRIFVI